MLVPEVTNVDEQTLNLLKNAKENDLYLSNISPLGVPFNSLRGNTKDIERLKMVKSGEPGSLCTKKYASLNIEFTEKAICVASRQYQAVKIEELNSRNLDRQEYNKEMDRIVAKTCICVGLGTSALMVNEIDTKAEGTGVSICPGPNMAYFSETMSLKTMIDHIYGRTNVIKRTDRPHMFVNELKMYIDYLKDKMVDSPAPLTDKQQEYLQTFKDNINDGIEYYKELFSTAKAKLEEFKAGVLIELEMLEKRLNLMEVLTVQLH